MREVPFLSALPKETQQWILNHTSHISRNKGEYLFRSGEVAGNLFFLRNGDVKICSNNADGREQIIAIFSAGEAIWEGLFIHDSHYIYSAVCVSTVECCVIDQRSFEEGIQSTNTAMQVISLLSHKLQDANQRNLIVSTYDPKARLAGFLLYEYERNHGERISMRLDDMAAAVCLRPETISRKISELQKDGIIEKSGRSGFKLLNVDALKRVFTGS